jgi:hypothetical protein
MGKSKYTQALSSPIVMKIKHCYCIGKFIGKSRNLSSPLPLLWMVEMF